MKSFFTYSRLVFEHRGGLEGAKKAIVDASRSTGEWTGGAIETLDNFRRRIEFIKTSKKSLRELMEGFSRTLNPLKKYPGSKEKNKQLVDFVVKQLGYSRKEIQDALYSEHTEAGETADQKRRGEIIQKLVILQSVLPEMELTFVGAAEHKGILPTENMDTYEARKLNEHDTKWYIEMKDLFGEMLELQIGPPDVALYINKHLYQIQEYMRSPDPMAVAKKYPKLFLTSLLNENNGHNLLDLVQAYEHARDYSRTLHQSPDVRKSSLGVPTPVRFDLYVYDSPQTRKNGVTMQYRQVSGGGLLGTRDGDGSDESASRRAEGSVGGDVIGAGAAGGAASERAPDGKEVERLDPIEDLNTYATKTLNHKWKGVKVDSDVDAKRYNLTDLTKYVARIERVLRDIDTDAKCKEFWPLLSEIDLTLTPEDIRDFNMFDEGFSWADGKLKIDYDESEDSIRHDIIDGLRAYNSYKKLGGAPEKDEAKKTREDLAKQVEMVVNNYDLLFFKDESNTGVWESSLNAWKTSLKLANNPKWFRESLKNDPQQIEKTLKAVRDAAREAYTHRLSEYVYLWDDKIGVDSVDGGGYTRAAWEEKLRLAKENTSESDSIGNIHVVIPWVRYFKDNLEGRRVPIPIIPGGSGDGGKEKAPDAGEQQKKAEAAISALSLKYGYPVTILPSRIGSQTYTYDYTNIIHNSGAIDAALADITNKEDAEGKAVLKDIGLSPTPEREIMKGSFLRHEGYVELPDGKKRILFKVTDNPTEMAVAISKGIAEAHKKSTDTNEKNPSREALKKQIIKSVKSRNEWKVQTPEAREGENFAGTGSSLTKIGKIFGIEGDPARENYAYKLLGDAIYGKEDTVENAGDPPKLKVEKMLLQMSDTYKFTIEIQPTVEYDYNKILPYKDNFDKAFGNVGANTKKVLAKTGVVLGETGMISNQEGIVKIDGRYRIAIDWNENPDKITRSLDEYAKKYESTNEGVRDACYVRLQAIKTAYSLKGIDYESGFSDFKDLAKYLDGLDKAFATLSDSDKKKLGKGFTIIVSNGAFSEGWVSDHTILIDYDEAPEDIKKDLSEGIEKQASKDSWLGKLKPW